MVPGAILEGSILFPTSAVPLEAQQSTPKRAAILAQEASFSQEANAFRRAAIRTEHRRAVFRWLLIAWAIGLLVMAIVLVLLGRRRDRIRGAPRTLTEPPEPSLHPAKLAMRWAFARRQTGLGNAFRAELLTLAAIQAVDVRPVGTVTQAKDFTLTLKQVPTDALDEKFADFLFPGDQPVDLDELEPDESQREDLRSWRRTLEADTNEQFPKGSGRAETETLGWAILVSLAAGIVFGIFAANVPLGLGLFVEAFVLWYVARRLLPPRPTQPAASALSGWNAFRRYPPPVLFPEGGAGRQRRHLGAVPRVRGSPRRGEGGRETGQVVRPGGGSPGAVARRSDRLERPLFLLFIPELPQLEQPHLRGRVELRREQQQPVLVELVLLRQRDGRRVQRRWWRGWRRHGRRGGLSTSPRI